MINDRRRKPRSRLFSLEFNFPAPPFRSPATKIQITADSKNQPFPVLLRLVSFETCESQNKEEEKNEKKKDIPCNRVKKVRMIIWEDLLLFLMHLLSIRDFFDVFLWPFVPVYMDKTPNFISSKSRHHWEILLGHNRSSGKFVSPRYLPTWANVLCVAGGVLFFFSFFFF